MTSEGQRGRLAVLALVVMSMFAALFARLYFLQVLSSDSYTLAAEANRVRTVQVAAPRGRILDRAGRVLVDSRVSVVVHVDRVRFRDLDTAEQDDLLARLSRELTRAGQPVTSDELRARIDDVRYSQYAPVPVAEDVPESLKIHLEEYAAELPAVSVERASVRRFPYGPVASHVLGYVGEINDVELAERADKPKSYIQGDQIGKTGVERIYEDDLRGWPGTRVIEVDVNGDPIRVLDETPPIPGDDVWLTIDADIQAYASVLLAEGLESARNQVVEGDNLPNEGTAGSVVVLDPSNGEILALASYPTFDPQEFVNGISTSRWEYLNDPGNHYPLNNWAIQGQYAPGSTFKLFTGYAALTSGLRTADQTLEDRGRYEIPACRGGEGGGCIRRNAGGRAYGVVDMRRALTVSSDVYFYAIGSESWIEQETYGREVIQDAARAFGFGSETGIPLTSEQSGRIPTAEQRRAQFEEHPDAFLTGDWFTGDNVNMAIGQGDVAATPLQLANAYATFANGGTRYAPNIAFRITDPSDPETVIRKLEPRRSATVALPPEVRQPLLDGLIGVTAGAGGTARSVFSGFPHESWPVAGKTGTAEVDGKADTAVFAAFGPTYDPRYQVTVVLEESGFGGRSAAPVARRLFDVFAGLVPRPRLELGGELIRPGQESAADPAEGESPADPGSGA